MFEELFQATIIVSVLAATVRIATPILLTALGETVAQRSGVYNMGLEGTMLMGAFAAFIGTYQTGSQWTGVLAGAGMGAMMSTIFAFMVITLRIEQIVTGLALNLLGAGLSTFWLRTAFADQSVTPTIAFMGSAPIPFLADIPYLGPILFRQGMLTYLAFLAVPLVWFFLFRTRYGLELRCIGENPKALDTKGLSVAGRRYAAVIFGGAMAGLGGAFLTVGSSARFVPDMTAGRGWLALVIVIAGIWRPGYVLTAALAFSFLDALQLQIQGVGINLPHQILLALPYIVAILSLALMRRNAKAPAMLGTPYARDR